MEGGWGGGVWGLTQVILVSPDSSLGVGTGVIMSLQALTGIWKCNFESFKKAETFGKGFGKSNYNQIMYVELVRKKKCFKNQVKNDMAQN